MNEDKDQAARAPANDVGDAAVGEFPDEGAATVAPEERVEALEQELAEAKDRLLRALGTIIEVLQPGYVLPDRLLRPAMVGVAKAGSPPAEDSAADEES